MLELRTTVKEDLISALVSVRIETKKNCLLLELIKKDADLNSYFNKEEKKHLILAIDNLRKAYEAIYYINA